MMRTQNILTAAVLSAVIVPHIAFAETKQIYACDSVFAVNNCDDTCNGIGSVNFQIDKLKRMVIKQVIPNQSPQAIYTELNRCIILDEKNWQCEDDEFNHNATHGKYKATRKLPDTHSVNGFCNRE